MTPNVEPSSFEFLYCVTVNTEWAPPEDGFYRINVFGKCADGGSGIGGQKQPQKWWRGYPGGAGGASGGFARSMLYLTTRDRITCTVNNSVTSFGNYLSATGATGQTGVGKGTGGNLSNLNGFKGGSGAQGEPDGEKRGGNGENDGARGATGGWYSGGGGGGYGGGAQIPMPYEGYNQQPKYTTPNNGAFSVTETDVTVSGGGRGGSGGPAA